MDSGIVTGIFCGVVSVVLCSYVSTKVARKSKDGQLGFGYFMAGAFWCSLAVACFCAYSLFFTDIDTERDLYPLIGLIVAFGASSTLLFGEAFKVNGRFDDESIVFYTPWTGLKDEKWKDLQEAKFNSNFGWYTLKFESGTKIRISILLDGHRLVVDQVKKLGHSL